MGRGGANDVEQRTDDDITDEATGQRRVELAAQSKAQKAEEARQLAAENEAYRTMNATVEQRTDDDITDEATGQRRVELAAESKARKAKEARELAARNAAMRAKRAAVGQRTDDDITDEATGQRRVELAAASAARRKAEAAKLAQQNAEMRAKRAAARQSQRTDDDIADEESGRLRTALAEEARRRRQEDTRALARQNAAFRRRLKGMRSRTDHRIGDPDVDAMEKLPPEHVREKVQLEEAEELAKLREMLARSTQGRPRSAPGGWDSSPHKPVPYTLRGLKPMYTSAAEPWSRHSAEEWNKLAQGPATRFATSGLKKLDDGQTDSIAQMYHRRRQEEEVAGKRTGRRPWDSTTWMYVPPALRGLKPVTNEPWARDAEANIGLEEFEALAIKQEL